MPKLVFTQTEFSQNFVELPDGTFSVGRSRRNMIIIEDASVSKEHAELLVNGNEFIVRERGSRNGTFVGEARIEAQSGVRHGQKIRFGRVELRLELEPPQYGETTNLTAMESLARMPDEAAGPARTPPRFPVIFSPRKSASEGKSTISSPRPEPIPPPPPAASPKPPTSTSHRSSRAWLWLTIGAGALVLAVSWLLKR